MRRTPYCSTVCLCLNNSHSLTCTGKRNVEIFNTRYKLFQPAPPADRVLRVQTVRCVSTCRLTIRNVFLRYCPMYSFLPHPQESRNRVVKLVEALLCVEVFMSVTPESR